jgi:hypothetical protein
MAGIIQKDDIRHPAHPQYAGIKKEIEVEQENINSPTVAEYVAAGYNPVNYPPAGCVSKSSPEEISAAILAYNKAAADAEAKSNADKTAADAVKNETKIPARKSETK